MWGRGRHVASGFAAIGLWSERPRNSTTFRERSKSSVKTWVLFRDQFGQVGLLGEHCASRSFVGVRRYRRWRVALPLPRLVVQRPRSVLGDASGAEGQQVKHLSYPVQELGGLLFAYMGQDKDDPPPLPNYAPLVERTGQWQIEPVRHAEYNWFNFFENSADPAHVCILRYLSRTQRPKRFSKHGRDQPTNNGASTNAQCQGAVRLINSDADRTRKGSG